MKKNQKYKKSNKYVKVWVKKETLLYEKELKKLQIELTKFQNHVKKNGLKVLIICEGRDTAGKGGFIQRMIQHLNPRGANISALEKPNEKERSQWYYQRYSNRLPSAGEITFFDRSYFNRVGVEKVMGFCTKKQHKQFLADVGGYEESLVKSGIILFKFYFSISKKEQSKRLQKRRKDPLKRHKISPIDKKAQMLWDEFTLAEEEMLLKTHTKHAPWVVIDTDFKKAARINGIKHFLSTVEYPDKLAKKHLEIDKKVEN